MNLATMKVRARRRCPHCQKDIIVEVPLLEALKSLQTQGVNIEDAMKEAQRGLPLLKKLGVL